MLTPMERILHLKKIPLFSGLQARELTAIASIAKERTFAPQTVIIREGDEGDCLFLIIRGKVSVIKGMGTPDEIHLADIGRDDHVGEMALFDREPRSASVVALEETHVLELSRFEFDETMREFPKIAIHACREFSKRYRELMAKVAAASVSEPEG